MPDASANAPASFDAEYASLERIWLDDGSWVDYAPGWVSGSGRLFDEIYRTRSWRQRSRRMYTGIVAEPRLSSGWQLASGQPLTPSILEEIRLALSRRYDVPFDSVGFNLYRDGRDSVAPHGDHIRADIPTPIVALVSLGHPRRFLLRPKVRRAETKFHRFTLGPGDLLVTGGQTQRTWEHSIPKVAAAGPRISLAYGNGLEGKGYADVKSRSSIPN